ncbi:MAG: hypothetical protein R6X12_05465 [bacterium]
MRKTLTVLAVLALSVGLAQELLVNGDFEQPLATGWTHTDSGYGTHQSDRAIDYHPDPDYEAMTYQYDNPGWSRLSQTVVTPGIQLSLSFWAKFEEAGGVSTCWPAACFSVRYLDGAGTALGETRWYYSTYANWVPSPTLSLHRITAPDWAEYSLDVAQEITANLPGVNPGDVAQLEVALFSYTYDG